MTPYEIEVLTNLILTLKSTEYKESKTLKDAETLLRNETIAPEAVDGCGYPIGTRGLDYYLVIGTNQCWGRGFSVEEALKNASKPKFYVAYKANTKRTPIMCCTDMGGYSYRGEEPVEVERKMPKQKKVTAVVK